MSDYTDSEKKEIRGESAQGIGQGALAGAASGAVVGSAFTPIGTAIGAGVGAIAGGLVGFFSAHAKAKDAVAAERADDQSVVNGRLAGLATAAAGMPKAPITATDQEMIGAASPASFSGTTGYDQWRAQTYGAIQ